MVGNATDIAFEELDAIWKVAGFNPDTKIIGFAFRTEKPITKHKII